MASAQQVSAPSATPGLLPGIVPAPSRKAPESPLGVVRKGPGRAEAAAPSTGEYGEEGAASVEPGGPDPRLEVKAILLADVQQACKQLSREQLAERFSDSAGRAFSLTALEKLWNPGKDVKNLSVGHLPAWVRATGSRRLLEWAAESAGYWLGTPADRRDAELGRRVREAGTALRLIVEQVLREAA